MKGFCSKFQYFVAKTLAVQNTINIHFTAYAAPKLRLLYIKKIQLLLHGFLGILYSLVPVSHTVTYLRAIPFSHHPAESDRRCSGLRIAEFILDEFPVRILPSNFPVQIDGKVRQESHPAVVVIPDRELCSKKVC